MARRSNNKSRKPLIFLIFLCIIALLGTSLWVSLRHGIVLDRIKLSFFEAKRISVQVDGGISISIARLDVLDRQTSDSFVHPELFITRFNNWAHLFREIQINQIHYQERIYNLLFKDNQFTISGDDFQLASTLAYMNGEVQLVISKLELKPYSVTLAGKATYIRKTEQLNFSGRFRSPEISGQLTFSQLKHQVNAEINTDQFTDLPNLIARFPLDQELTTWISENISARYYLVEQLKMHLTLEKGKAEILPYSISGKAIATDAAIRFHPSLSPVQSKQILISFENDQLSFELDEPMYQNKSLDGSSVSIDSLLTGDSQMNINIRTKTQLDSKVIELLETYDIRLPLSQQTGITRADLHLTFDLPEFTLRTKGVFATGEGDWSWDDISFQTSGATVQLKDDLVTIQKADIEHQDMFKASLAGTIDTSTQKASLTTNIGHLNLRDGEKDIIKVQNLITPINIQFSEDDVNIHLAMLQANITLNQSHKLITLNNLNMVKSFIPSLTDFPFQEGKVHIDFIDLSSLTFEGYIKTTSLHLSSNGKPVTHYRFQGSKNAEQLTASINEGKISLAISDRIDIKLHDYVLVINTNNTGRGKTPSLQMPLHMSGPKGRITFKDSLVLTNNFQAELNDSYITYTAKLDQGEILFQSTSEGMTLAATDIDAQVMRNLIPHGNLEGGRFNASIKGTPENFEGYIEFSNVLLKNYVVLNNVLTFINAIPALATFSSPGFDANGYRVKEGVMRFNLTNKFLTVHNFRTDGETINTEAEGWVDFGNDTLELKMELVSLKDYSKIINIIPLAGYALLGEDGSMSTSLDITGSRTEPEITTHISEDIVMLPLNIVKRTIEWPFVLFGKIKEFVNEKPETNE